MNTQTTKRSYKPRDKQHVDFATQITEKQLLSWLAKDKLRHTDIGLEKQCPICKEYWPYDNDFFYSQKSACIDCFQQRKARYEAANQTDI